MPKNELITGSFHRTGVGVVCPHCQRSISASLLDLIFAIYQDRPLKCLACEKDVWVNITLLESRGPTLFAADASQICVACGLPFHGEYKYHQALCTKRR